MANELEKQILAYTKIDVNPKNPQPGEAMTVETIPGIIPFIYPTLSGEFDLPPLGTDIPVVIETLVKGITFSVKYTVKVEDPETGELKDTTSLTIQPLTPLSLPDSDPLLALLRVLPPLVAEHQAKPTLKGELVATVTVTVEGGQPFPGTPVAIPLQLVPIPVPTLLILKSDPNDEDYPTSKVLVMTRLGSALSSASAAVSTLNAAIQTLNSVKDIPGGAAFDLLLGDLNDAVSQITSPGFSIAGFAVEEAPNFDDLDDFDDEARSCLMIGPVGTTAWFYNSFDFNNSDEAGEDESSKFEITNEIGTTGLGVLRVTDLKQRNWDTDPSDDPMDDIESCNFGESKWEDQPN